ncbi:Glycine/D-amino acid oxidase [Hymenobacter gelipurpurascens]|uniref:Glycine/D-amino acid oxidase n=1 Tax=Hymenobacter gelipurpurascens TaxID=89968 RepID=A0A212TRH1_9BACT|nr:FAD-dependent oxidoreductase [Hymenobacter gelipurpurascens]SNC68613.1 Glycine/D-amino acid oxidase [Hymenobacter gelipurpurascens]
MIRVDYLIIGHGIAGATLAQELRRRGRSVLVLDTPQPDSASNVAAGLMNPVAGKRYALAWRAEELMPAAVQFYQELETRFGQTFFYEAPILKLFSSVAEQNTVLARSADNPWGNFVQDADAPLPAVRGLKQEFGGLRIQRGGHVLVREVLAALAAEGIREGWLQHETFAWEQLVPAPDGGSGLQYANRVQAQHVVCCEGAAAVQNPYFHWLPLTPNQGEVLNVECHGLSDEYVLNKGAYVVPLGNGQFRVGATYRWPPFAAGITDDAQQELSQRLEAMTSEPFRITEQRAGVRPAVRDRKPLLGTHPARPEVHMFNGFGSKGVMMAPRLANLMADFLENGTELWPEVNIRRYSALYNTVLAAAGAGSSGSR